MGIHVVVQIKDNDQDYIFYKHILNHLTHFINYTNLFHTHTQKKHISLYVEHSKLTYTLTHANMGTLGLKHPF